MNKQHSTRTVSAVGFVLVVLAIVGLGLSSVMVITTAVGAQSRELSALQNRANELDYESAALRTQLERLSSTGSLTLRASELGMVPNPYPAYVMLGEGTVLGEPKAVQGNEFPQLRGQAPEPDPSPSPAPVTTPTPLPPDPEEVQDEAREDGPEDAVAASDGEAGSTASAAPDPAASPEPAPTPKPSSPATAEASPAPSPVPTAATTPGA